MRQSLCQKAHPPQSIPTNPRFKLASMNETASTFAAGVGVVAVDYGILAIWFWNMIPIQITKE
jgi:hypothetical protein